MKDTSSLLIRSDAPEVELRAKAQELGMFSSHLVRPVSLGRSSLEERRWWNSEVRERYSRPGPGILPSMLPGVGQIVDDELFAIEVAAPSPNQSSPSLPSSEKMPGSSPPPSDEEIYAAIPHPRAYYSPKHNSWILLSWGTSMEPPPLAPSFKQQHNVDAVFRREERRLLLNCTVFLQLNHTHHFHKFPSAVDPARLDPPYEPDGPRGDSGPSALPLDLYVCCQCQVYLIASSFSQPFVPEFLWNAFLEEKRQLSSPETTHGTTIVTSLKLLHTAIKNKLWRGEDRLFKTTSLSFKRKLGSFTPITKEFFEFIGFSVCRIGEIEGLVPGPTDGASPEGLRNRSKMLRIWVEIGAFLTYFIEKNGQKLYLREGGVVSKAPFWVHLTEYHQTESVPSVGLLQTTSFEPSSLEDLTQNLALFGMISTHYSPSLLTFAYRAQCRCDPKNSVEYFSSLCEIENQLQMKGNDTSFLQTFISDERSRGRFTRDDIHEAVLILGLSDALHLFLSNDSSGSAPASDIVSKLTIGAWKSVYKTIAHLSEHEATEHAKHANEALRILSQVQGSEWLQGVWLTWKDRSVMTLEEAYDTLGTYESTGDDRIAELYSHEVHTSASFSERYALMVIAESRASDSLRRLAEIGGSEPKFSPFIPQLLLQIAI
ncbi:hypothetical protein DL96DRAFT_533929 [Flagelloscypha sp. PMI_526]|nr:hypothetical protein DL96DRAFT_533929 [Flagelloscypha sp. PMI_526]